MVQCSICGKKNDCMLYTLFMANYKEKYLKLKKVQQKRAFIKENYKEHCHIGCIVFYLPLVSIIQEKYYLTKDKCVTDFIFFGLEHIHKSKHQPIECSICDKGLGNVSAPEKKASIACGLSNCGNQYHIDCIINVRKRISCTRARLNFYCNKHFDKNEPQADWSNWNNIAMNLVIENTSIRQEEQYQGEQKCIVVSVDDPNDIEGVKLDQKSFKRLDEDLVKRQKPSRREAQVEAEKKRQKFWDISKDFKSQYEFGPRPLFQIDYSAKRKDDMMLNTEDIDQLPQKRLVKEEIIITDEGIQVNKIEKPVKQKTQSRIQSSKKIDDDALKNFKTEQVDLDFEVKLLSTQSQDNGQVSLDQLLNFVREKKNTFPQIKQNQSEERKLKQSSQNIDSKIQTQPIESVKQLNKSQEEKQLYNYSLNTDVENKKKSQPKQPIKESALPNADMIDPTEKKEKQSKVLEDYSSMSATELLNFLLKNQQPSQSKNRSRNTRKNDTTRAIQQKQELIYYPQPDEAWEENIQDFWGKIEEIYFTPKQDIYTIIEEFRKQDNRNDEMQNIIKILFEFKEQGILLAEYRLDDDEDYEQLYKDDLQINKYQIYSTQKNLKQSPQQIDVYENDQFPKLVLENLYPIDQSNQPTQDAYEQFIQKKDSSIYIEQHIEQFYQTQLDKLIQQNQNEIKLLNQYLVKDRANQQIYRQGNIYLDKLRHFALLKNTIQGMKWITDEKHQLTIKKKVELLTMIRTENFSGKCNIKNLKQSQKDELANETCCKICFNYQLVQIESNNDLAYCSQCWTTFHKNCYNINESFENCDMCRILQNQQIQQECYLCKKYYVGLPLRQIETFWVHITCALLAGLLEFNQNSFKIKKGIMQQSQACCLVCDQKEGYKIQCSQCTNSLHILCAYFWGFIIEVKTEPECMDPYIFTSFKCPQHHQYDEKEISKQIYYRWHGINYNQAANFETFDIFLKGKLIAHQKTISKILALQN